MSSEAEKKGEYSDDEDDGNNLKEVSGTNCGRKLF